MTLPSTRWLALALLTLVLSSCASSNAMSPRASTASPPSSGAMRAVVYSPPANQVQTRGTLDPGAIQNVVNAHLREVQRCYEKRMLKEPSLEGRLVFAWIIEPTGLVGDVKVKSSTMPSAEVPACIQESIRHWQFQPPTGGSVTVIYPFVFETCQYGKKVGTKFDDTPASAHRCPREIDKEPRSP